MPQTRPRPSKASPRWQGEVANAAALPPTGNRVADVRVAKDTLIPWIWTGTAWQHFATPAGGLNYQGVWDATNPPAGGNPTLADGVGTKGDYYVVSVAGVQDLGRGLKPRLPQRGCYQRGVEFVHLTAEAFYI